MKVAKDATAVTQRLELKNMAISFEVIWEHYQKFEERMVDFFTDEEQKARWERIDFVEWNKLQQEAVVRDCC
jgi:hypothetical protein